MNILTTLILSVPIYFGSFEFCGDFNARHNIVITDDVISDNWIKICTNAPDIKFTTIHELGHQYWHLHLSLVQRNEYRALQTDNPIDYSRDYAMTNEEEDFADNFANIILGRDWLNKSQNYRDKRKYITQLLKR